MACHPTELYSLAGSMAAADFTVGPQLTEIVGADAFQTWSVPYEILGMSLTSSLTNFGTRLMGLFVVIGPTQPKLSYGRSTPALLAHITGNNSIVGPPAIAIPSDKTVTRVFLQPIQVPTGKRVSLFAFGDTTAGNALSAFVSLDMRRV